MTMTVIRTMQPGELLKDGEILRTSDGKVLRDGEYLHVPLFMMDNRRVETPPAEATPPDRAETYRGYNERITNAWRDGKPGAEISRQPMTTADKAQMYADRDSALQDAWKHPR